MAEFINDIHWAQKLIFGAVTAMIIFGPYAIMKSIDRVVDQNERIINLLAQIIQEIEDRS